MNVLLTSLTKVSGASDWANKEQLSECSAE